VDRFGDLTFAGRSIFSLGRPTTLVHRDRKAVILLFVTVLPSQNPVCSTSRLSCVASFGMSSLAGGLPAFEYNATAEASLYII